MRKMHPWMEKQDEYLSKGGGFCPYCDKKEIAETRIKVESDCLTRRLFCKSCGKRNGSSEV